MGVASLMLGWGLNEGMNGVSAVGVFGFVSTRGRGGRGTRRGRGNGKTKLIFRLPSFPSLSTGWIFRHRTRTRSIHH